MAGARQHQIADRIKVIVAELLERRVKDPRLGFVTITDVRVTGDHQHASVFYTVLGDAEAIEGSGAALRSATGMLRSEVAKRLGLRLAPSLEFFLDAVPDSARHIDELLAKARSSDAEVASRAEGAQYAGDADPYKRPADEADDASDDDAQQ
ncbi:30S ribosome-binding factor RbfA [Aeromicrobium sp. Leaf350]|uniref:30S ribosome-binding factor RbfA n=1 Tax=Aeromicrobium sp. Leaf350 TaxID=2876565 RepID=UPI001E46439B|nr:30S ribosome-binding factor RbfA [Aeromicrobium sp. Leaf350]